MPAFIASMRVVHMETWTVEAENLDDARDKLDHMNPDVQDDETGGEIIDWEITSIREDKHG